MLGALLLTCCAACGADNSLEGSISEEFSLEFQEVKALKQQEALRIEYLGRAAGRTTKVCKLVIDTRGLSLGDETAIRRNLFLERVVLTRVDMTGEEFPPVKSGNIMFDKFRFKDGGKLRGEFGASFETGHTIRGTFDVRIKEIDFE